MPANSDRRRYQVAVAHELLLRLAGSAPDDLLAHIRAAGYRMPAVDGPAMHRVMAALTAPSAEEPVWAAGGTGASVGGAGPAPAPAPALGHSDRPDVGDPSGDQAGGSAT